MSVTLEQVWSTDIGEIQKLLTANNVASTQNIGHNRSLLAILYYNNNQLAEKTEIL